jgi:hypothetical protein
MLAIYCSLIWRIWFQTVFNIQLQFSKGKFLCEKKKQIKQIKCKVPEDYCYVKLILTHVKCLSLACYLEENLWKNEMGMWKLRFWLVGYEVKERMNKGLTLRGWEEKVGIHEWKFAILWINSGKWYWERRKVRVKKDNTFLLWYELIIGFSFWCRIKLLDLINIKWDLKQFFFFIYNE